MARNRVLILSTSAGNGHLRAAAALEEVFRQDNRVEEVLHEDALKFTNTLFREFYSSLYTKLVQNAPALVGYFYKASDEPWKNDAVRHQFDRLNTRPLVKFIGEFRPDFIVCTHFMPAGIIAHLIERGELQVHLSIVVTDFDCHAMWLSRVFHRYFVALEETQVHLEALGLPPERVTLSGIPISPRFAGEINRNEARKRYGLQEGVPTLLLSAGAVGVSPAEFIVQRLRDHLKTEVQVLVICGRNEELRRKVAAEVGEINPMFHILGYTNEMAELMQISDLFIGKPGGLTTSEALACGLPMAIIEPIPGQEERNSDHLLEKGIAIKCNELTTLPFKIDQLLADPDRLAAMKRNALALARPHAARTVVETLLCDQVPVHVVDEKTAETMTQLAVHEK